MSFASLGEVFRYIESFTNLEKSGSLFSARTYRLDRMRLLLERFGNPQTRYRTVHIAGTKGKGSTACLLAQALHAAGERTGLYTSPHVVSYLERMEVLGSPADAGKILALAARVRSAVEELPGELIDSMGAPNTFELLTLLAFLYFLEMGCSIVVVETGIGGRLDATNLVRPELCLITPIELEHTDVLGDTLEAIAGEKAGIFKRGVPVYSSAQEPAVREVLRRAAAASGSPILFLDEELQEFRAGCTARGTEVRFRLRSEEASEYHLSLIGTFQGENAVLVHLAARRSLALSPEALRRGFGRARLPGRMELLREEPAVVLDGAHTPLSIGKVLETFTSLFGGEGVLLFGAARGKKIAEMAAILAPAFGQIVITRPGSYRESNAAEVFREFAARNAAAILEEDTADGLRRARALAGAGRPLLVTGSFYLVGEVRRMLADSPGGGASPGFAPGGASPGRAADDRHPLEVSGS